MTESWREAECCPRPRSLHSVLHVPLWGWCRFGLQSGRGEQTGRCGHPAQTEAAGGPPLLRAERGFTSGHTTCTCDLILQRLAHPSDLHAITYRPGARTSEAALPPMRTLEQVPSTSQHFHKRAHKVGQPPGGRPLTQTPADSHLGTEHPDRRICSHAALAPPLP